MLRGNGLNMSYEYHDYQRNTQKYTNQLDIRKSVTTKRHGLAKIRDNFINFERYYTEGWSYLNLVNMILTWTVLGGLALSNFNLLWFIFTLFVVGIMVFLGFLSYTRFGFISRYNELNAMTDGGRFQIWGELQDVKSQNVTILRQLDEMLEYNAKMKKQLRKKK